MQSLGCEKSLIRINLVLTLFHQKSSKGASVSIYFFSFCPKVIFLLIHSDNPVLYSFHNIIGLKPECCMSGNRRFKGKWKAKADQRGMGSERVQRSAELRKPNWWVCIHKRREEQRREQESWKASNGGQRDIVREIVEKEKHTKKNLRSVGGEISITAQLIHFSSLWSKLCWIFSFRSYQNSN